MITWLKVFVAFMALIAVARSIPRPLSSDIDLNNFRLPNNTRPVHYDVSLSTDIHRGDFEFSGRVRITIEVLQATREIALHYRQIAIENVDLFSASEPSIPLEANIEHSLIEELEFLVIPTAIELSENERFIVEIAYSGVLRTDNQGFFRSFYNNSDGQTVWLATTQYQATDARHAYPCYDEPQIRATYAIAIRHDASYFAVSNMPVESITPEAETNYVTTRFEVTPSVHSYLISFTVSEYGSVGNEELAVPQRVYAKPRSIELGEANLGLEAGQLLLETFERHIGVPYGLPKLDQVAVPDYSWGAMEHWGVCSYREEFLLFNRELGTSRQRDGVLRIVAHEYLVSLNFR